MIDNGKVLTRALISCTTPVFFTDNVNFSTGKFSGFCKSILFQFKYVGKSTLRLKFANTYAKLNILARHVYGNPVVLYCLIVFSQCTTYSFNSI